MHTWQGTILAVQGEEFTAELHPTSEAGHPLHADFDLAVLGDDATQAAPGDIIDVTVPTDPQAGSGTVQLRQLGPVTPAEIQAAYAEADEWLTRLAPLFDKEPQR